MRNSKRGVKEQEWIDDLNDVKTKYIPRCRVSNAHVLMVMRPTVVDEGERKKWISTLDVCLSTKASQG